MRDVISADGVDQRAMTDKGILFNDPYEMVEPIDHGNTQ